LRENLKSCIKANFDAVVKLSKRLLSTAVGPPVRHSDRQHGAEISTPWDQLLTWNGPANFPMGQFVLLVKGGQKGANIEVGPKSGPKNSKNPRIIFSDLGVV